MARITIVGAGPGSPDYVTPIARKVVQNASFVVGAERLLSLFKDNINGEALKLTAKNLTDVVQKCIEYAEKGKTVAILSTGDPGFAGLLRTFQKISKKGKKVELNVIPGVSSIQACAAKLAISWDTLTFISFHEGVNRKKKQQLLSTIKKRKDIMLLPNPKAFMPNNVARFLVEEGIAADTPVVVCENLSLNNELVEYSTLEDICGKTFDSLCVMVVRPDRK
jgi:cobalt-precorrin-7 (C5)-methyltransferase